MEGEHRADRRCPSNSSSDSSNSSVRAQSPRRRESKRRYGRIASNRICSTLERCYICLCCVRRLPVVQFRRACSSSPHDFTTLRGAELDKGVAAAAAAGKTVAEGQDTLLRKAGASREGEAGMAAYGASCIGHTVTDPTVSSCTSRSRGPQCPARVSGAPSLFVSIFYKLSASVCGC